MAGDITKFDFSDNLRNNLGLQNVQPPINKVASFVQPVAEIIKFSNICKEKVSTSTGSTTIYTTSSDKEFYLTSIQYSITKDVNADFISGGITVLINGLLTVVAMVKLQTLTAESHHLQMSLPYPLRLDKASAITLAGNFTAGAVTKWGAITGIEI